MNRFLASGACGWAMAAACAAALAQPAAQYPAKPIRVVVAQEAGSAGDVGMRSISPALAEALGQPLVVENRPGAAGVLGIGVAAAAEPNGYTMLSVGSPMMIIPYANKNLKWDLLRDFVAVGRYSISHNVLVVPAGLPVANVKELIALVKSKPGQLNMGTAGPGSASHLGGALFNAMAGLESVAIPYKGGGSAIIGLVAGETQYYVAPLTAVIGQVKTGRLKALGVGGESRAPQLPDVPTVEEAGLAGFRSMGWNGLMMPAGTPAAFTAKVGERLGAIVSTAAVREQILKSGAEPAHLSGPEFGKFMREEHERFGVAAKAADLKPE
jgi:tripartite-type tricarboxylate transporter receptor subunit TctC